jgi:hypothetical protein
MCRFWCSHSSGYDEFYLLGHKFQRTTWRCTSENWLLHNQYVLRINIKYEYKRMHFSSNTKVRKLFSVVINVLPQENVYFLVCRSPTFSVSAQTEIRVSVKKIHTRTLADCKWKAADSVKLFYDVHFTVIKWEKKYAGELNVSTTTNDWQGAKALWSKDSLQLVAILSASCAGDLIGWTAAYSQWKSARITKLSCYE